MMLPSVNSSPAVSVVIATAFRTGPLICTLEHLSRQTRKPERVVVADGAPAPGVESLVLEFAAKSSLPITYLRCVRVGAAAQRNEAIEHVREEVILFMDDDLYAEPECIDKMLSVFQLSGGDSRLSGVSWPIGGVGAILVNQHGHPPSRAFKRWLDFLADQKCDSYAGKVIGPAVNLLPELHSHEEIVPVEWLNSGCTAYRRETFLESRFGERFEGYSFMEDVDLSVRINKRWGLVVHTGARAYHDSQPSRFKRPFLKARMAVVNRYHVMASSLKRTSLRHHVKFLALQLMTMFFILRDSIRSRRISEAVFGIGGTLAGCVSIIPSVCIVVWSRLFRHDGTAT
jgi:glycosyltransferase involved in cell wall biosynthesis